MMLIYRQLTGGCDIAGFWKTSPAELGTWVNILNGEAIAQDCKDVPDEGEVED